MSECLFKKQTVCCWHKNRHIDQHNRIESRNKPMHLWSINLDKDCKNIQRGKDHFFNNLCWENWTVYMQKNRTRPFSYNIYKNKLIMD